MYFWIESAENQNFTLEKGLEIGARNGGLSWFFAQHFNSQMTCTDFGGPSEKAQQLHQQSGLNQRITHQDADATQLPFADETFDFVVFKSVLGAVGRDNSPENQQRALAETHRVLKPGGVLFFAENLSGSLLHRLARRVFVPWGKSWRYLKISELQRWLGLFEQVEIHSTGFFAAFIPKPVRLKNLVANLDSGLFFLPKNWHYVGFGWGRKAV